MPWGEGHRHMLRQASAWSPLFGQNVLRIVVVTVMVVMVVMGGGGGNGDGNGGDGGGGGDGGDDHGDGNDNSNDNHCLFQTGRRLEEAANSEVGKELGKVETSHSK